MWIGKVDRGGLCSLVDSMYSLSSFWSGTAAARGSGSFISSVSSMVSSFLSFFSYSSIVVLSLCDGDNVADGEREEEAPAMPSVSSSLSRRLVSSRSRYIFQKSYHCHFWIFTVLISAVRSH